MPSDYPTIHPARSCQVNRSGKKYHISQGLETGGPRVFVLVILCHSLHHSSSCCGFCCCCHDVACVQTRRAQHRRKMASDENVWMYVSFGLIGFSGLLLVLLAIIGCAYCWHKGRQGLRDLMKDNQYVMEMLVLAFLYCNDCLVIGGYFKVENRINSVILHKHHCSQSISSPSCRRTLGIVLSATGIVC